MNQDNQGDDPDDPDNPDSYRRQVPREHLFARNAWNQGDTGRLKSTGSKAIRGNQGDRASEIQGDTPSTPLPTVLEAAEIICTHYGAANPYGAARRIVDGRESLWKLDDLIADALAKTDPAGDRGTASAYWHAQVKVAARVLRDAGLVG